MGMVDSWLYVYPTGNSSKMKDPETSHSVKMVRYGYQAMPFGIRRSVSDMVIVIIKQ